MRKPVKKTRLKPAQSTRRIAQEYFDYVTELIRKVDLDRLEEVVQRLRDARDQGACVYIMGNGGSAATASHFANDLGKLGRTAEQSAIRAFSLTDNTPWLTALANDEGYENVFVGQLCGHLRRGDLVIAISASGNSPNLIGAVKMARERGAITIGILGFSGGALLKMVDTALLFRSSPGAYGPVEDLHLIVEHVITACLAQGWRSPRKTAGAGGRAAARI